MLLLTQFPHQPLRADAPLIMGRKGVVVSGHHLASNIGLDILKKGGNAIDAGVATVFAQSVLEPDRFTLGGEAPILIHVAGQKRVVVIDGQGFAPAAASVAWFRERGIEAIPGDCFLPAVVPGVLDALILALDEFGTMSLADVAGPSVELAEQGFPVYPTLRTSILFRKDRFENHWPTSAKIFLPGGTNPSTGDILVQKDLAKTFRRLLDAEAQHLAEGRHAGLQAARDLFYQGEIAREIVDFQSKFECLDANGVTSTGLLTTDDFAAYRATVEEPLSTTYKDVVVYKPGFWSQGPVMLEMLNLIESFDIRSMKHNSTEYVHLLSEAMKLAFADREQYYGDPKFTSVPAKGLLSKEYAAQRRALIDLESPSLVLRPGDPYPFEPKTIAHAPIPDAIELRPDAPGTTGTRAADAAGNVFSAVPSGGLLTHSPVIEGLGFSLNVRGQSFWLDDSHPNRLEPRKRPRTTLTPTLAVRDGQPLMAWGTPGGDGQDQVNLQVFLNVVEYGMDAQEAVEAPLFQILDVPASVYPRKAQPGVVWYGDDMREETVEELPGKGYKLIQIRGGIGDPTAIVINPESGVMFAGASPRRSKSYAAGW